MLDDGQLNRDREGYLFDPKQWNTAVARRIAYERDLKLSNEHWNILSFMRHHLATEEVVPDVHQIENFPVAQGNLYV